MPNRCGDCDYLNYRDTKWDGEKVWCRYKNYYVKPEEVACNEYTYHGHRYGRYLVTATCKILKISENETKELFKAFDTIRFDKTPETDYIYDLISSYDIIGPFIADKLLNDDFKEVIADSMYNNYILPCYNLINDKKYLEAISKYEDMTNTLINYYTTKNNQRTKNR